MSQKAPKPTLTGHRSKTRKRDEKEKYDPAGFREQILLGIEGVDLAEISKFLDTAGSRLDYRRYVEVLFDILFAGGILAPGGSLIEDEKVKRCDPCVFLANDDLESIKAWDQVFNLLIRRYKYLEKGFVEELKKILLYLKEYTPDERSKLAKITGIFLAYGRTPATILESLYRDHLVKEGLSLEFVTVTFVIWNQEKDINHIATALKRAGLENKLLELLPQSKRTSEYFANHFNKVGLEKLVTYMELQRTAGSKKELAKELSEMMEHGEPLRDMVAYCKEQQKKNSLDENEVAVLIWKCLMDAVEWNKKEDLVADQALRHLKVYAALLAEFTSQGKSELHVLQKIQEYCYDNMNFMKCFQKIVILFYKTDVLSEDAIIKWYKESHIAKGKSVFLQQMQKFIEWLQSAEEESSEEDDA
ncbi:eIF5-mimic protein 2-like [Glandiceps talaboti]